MNEIKTHEGIDNDVLRGFLNSTLKQMMSTISAECGSLFLFDSGNNELVLNSFYNSGDICLEGLRQKVGEGVAGKVVGIKAPILVRDIGTDSRFKRNGFGHYRTNSFISIPLFTSQGLLGLINLADKSSGESFCEKDLDVVTTISRYVSLTIESLHISSAELKQKKEALDKQKSHLEKYASMGKLAAGVVHEINNPLDGVIRYANILLEQMDSNSLAREYLLEVKNGLTRIANITKSLLEFSRQVNNAGPSRVKKYVDLHLVIDETLGILIKERRGSNIQITKKYATGLPKIHDLGISHVVINLLRNALDAMPENGKLEILTRVNDAALEILIKDNGTGIAKEIREHIFEPFFTTKDVNKGTGLGLSICNEIAHKYEGSIAVDSCVGQGSTFTVSLPKKHLQNA